MSAISGTKSLSFHLENAPAELCASMDAAPIKKARSDIRSFKGFEKKKSAQERKKLFQDSVVRWIMKESIPFRVVEAQSFRSMVNSVVENSNEHNMFTISRPTVRAKILKLGQLCREATKNELQIL